MKTPRLEDGRAELIRGLIAAGSAMILEHGIALGEGVSTENLESQVVQALNAPCGKQHAYELMFAVIVLAATEAAIRDRDRKAARNN